MKLLYFPLSQPSRAVTWFIKKHNLPIELEIVDILKGATHTPEFAEKNIFQAVPILQLEDGSWLSESGAILNYLAAKFNAREEYPETPEVLARIHEAELRHDSLARFVTPKLLHPALARMRNPNLSLDDVKSAVSSHSDTLTWTFSTLNTIFGKQRYVAGERFTIADYLVICELNQVPSLEVLLPDALKLHNFPNILRYLEDAKAQPLHDEFVAAFVGVAAKLVA